MYVIVAANIHCLALIRQHIVGLTRWNIWWCFCKDYNFEMKETISELFGKLSLGDLTTKQNKKESKMQ